MGQFSMHLFCILVSSSKPQIHRFGFVIMLQRPWLLLFNLLLIECDNSSTLPSVYSFEWSSGLGILPLASLHPLHHSNVSLYHSIASFHYIIVSFHLIVYLTCPAFHFQVFWIFKSLYLKFLVQIVEFLIQVLSWFIYFSHLFIWIPFEITAYFKNQISEFFISHFSHFKYFKFSWKEL